MTLQTFLTFLAAQVRCATADYPQTTSIPALNCRLPLLYCVVFYVSTCVHDALYSDYLCSAVSFQCAILKSSIDGAENSGNET
ncbi:hypothetical protein T4D_2900 [Trichinella pseudospiralis]|uniref:Secreted protein n=1 Tax=Trichinella pseudospiralis TaxID=6337 RepID=A0A0V1FYZ6_TRIPS|nr:hypothetical protein T4D_2900 [Trichinella pseudospiralis]